MFDFTCTTSVKAEGGGICQAQSGTHLERTADYWVLVFVREKCLDMEVGGEDLVVRKDDILFLPAGIMHRGTRPYPPGLVFYWLHFRVDKSDLNLPLDIPLHTTLTRPHIMVELMRRYLDDQHSGRLRDMPLRGDLYLCQMLCEVSGNHRDTSALPEAAVALASRVEALIGNRFHLDLSTALLAGEMGCCPDHLGRVFKAVTGATVTEAIHHCRINKASQLLIETTLGVDQIGYQVGFNDRAYFRRVFKRLRQTTPSAYRSLHSRATING